MSKLLISGILDSNFPNSDFPNETTSLEKPNNESTLNKLETDQMITSDGELNQTDSSFYDVYEIPNDNSTLTQLREETTKVDHIITG